MNRRLHEALIGVQLSARGLFFSLQPYLLDKESYGRINFGCEDVAEKIHISVQKVRQAMGELQRARILIEGPDGYRCPYMDDERRNFALREEIRTVFARITAVHVSAVQEEGGDPLPTRNGKH